MRRLPYRSVVSCILVAAATGCASLRAVATDDAPAGRDARDLLTSDALREVENLSAYEAIRRLQPRWLNERGPSVLVRPARAGRRVYLDGLYFGDMSSLKRMSVRTIQEIRFLSAGEATLRYGTGHPDGAFDIFTRQGFRAR